MWKKIISGWWNACKGFVCWSKHGAKSDIKNSIFSTAEYFFLKNQIVKDKLYRKIILISKNTPKHWKKKSWWYETATVLK